MHSLAFSGSDKVALSTFWSSICHLVRLSKHHSEELSLTISACERERLKNKSCLVLFLRAHGDEHFGHSAVDQRAGAGQTKKLNATKICFNTAAPHATLKLVLSTFRFRDCQALLHLQPAAGQEVKVTMTRPATSTVLEKVSSPLALAEEMDHQRREHHSTGALAQAGGHRRLDR